MKRFCVLILLLVILLFIRSSQYKEQFQDVDCEEYNTCVSCANKSKCTWCSATKKCLTKSEIANTDTLCNPMNLIYTVPMCHTELESAEPIAKPTVSNKDMEGNPLYNDQIANKTAPPMVYMNRDMEYSPETVMGNMNNLRHEIYNLKHLVKQ